MSVTIKEVPSDKVQPIGALQELGDSWLEQPKAHHVHRLLPHQESDSPETEETWESSADRSSLGWCPRRGPSPGAGAGTLSRAEQKPPGEEPVNLVLQRTSPGRLEERGSLTPESG